MEDTAEVEVKDGKEIEGRVIQKPVGFDSRTDLG